MYWVKALVLHRTNLPDMGAHINTPLGQNLFCHRPCKDQGSRQAARKVAAAPVVVAAVVADMGRIIGMARSGQIILIIPGPGIGVFNDAAEGRTTGTALKQAGQNLDGVGLPPGRGQQIFTRSPAVHFPCHGLHIQHQSRGDVFQYHTDGRAVGFSKNRIAHGLYTSSALPPRAA